MTFLPTLRTTYTNACKARRRDTARRRRDRAQVRKAVWIVNRMAISAVEREWRVKLLTGPDDRDLTGRVMGDPRYMRSALYARRQGWI